jgi:CheY-like chemotaxis protein
VLVVDDDKDFRALARKVLGPAGFEVSEAPSVAECLAHLRRYATDLVILDIIMPERDGIEALCEVKALFPATKIVTVSGADGSELYLKVSAHLGADASLNKAGIASLCALVKVVLDS